MVRKIHNLGFGEICSVDKFEIAFNIKEKKEGKLSESVSFVLPSKEMLIFNMCIFLDVVETGFNMCMFLDAAETVASSRHSQTESFSFEAR